MRLRRVAGPAIMVLAWCACAPWAAAQDLTLGADSEDGFRRLMRMAQTGQLGDEVVNANIAIAHDRVHVELVGPGGDSKHLTVTRSPLRGAGFFAVTAGDGASASDAERVSRALDAAFDRDPFRVAGLEETAGDTVVPGLADAWRDDGWRGLARVGERRMMANAGRAYTVGVIVLLAAGLSVSVILLLGSHRTQQMGR